MAKIITIKGQLAPYLEKLRFDKFEDEMKILHINADYITSIYETIFENTIRDYKSGPQTYKKEIRCISREGELNNVYTNETIENLIKLINS